MNFEDPQLLTSWKAFFKEQSTQTYYRQLLNFLEAEKNSGRVIYPSSEKVLRVFKETDYSKIKVVILGQDPYHQIDQAIGRSFAVPLDLKTKPPSLLNIYKELSADLKIPLSSVMQSVGSDLQTWVDQGVFLLNTVLTVRANEPLSHRDQGWELFTDEVIRFLNRRSEPMVFILWGAAAQQKQEMISQHHLCLLSAHPSPLSAYRGFFGSSPFSKTNEFLKLKHQSVIQWT